MKVKLNTMLYPDKKYSVDIDILEFLNLLIQHSYIINVILPKG